MAFDTRDTAPEIAARIRIEETICKSLVSELLEQGGKLSVYDGESVTVRNSSDASVILEALQTTDEDTVSVILPDGTRGSFFLVYGNDGWDVICDQSTNMDAFIPRTNALVESLAA